MFSGITKLDTILPQFSNIRLRSVPPVIKIVVGEPKRLTAAIEPSGDVAVVSLIIFKVPLSKTTSWRYGPLIGEGAQIKCALYIVIVMKNAVAVLKKKST